jgi:probable HAF family extracellular repeat protein
MALAINARGDLAGTIYFDVFRDTAEAGIEDLGASAYPTSINRQGDVVGYVTNGRSFIASAGSLMTEFGNFGSFSSYAGGINDFGQVSGYAQKPDGSIRAFLYTPGIGIQDLGWPNSRGRGINNSAQLTGSLLTAASRSHAFRYTPGVGFQDLDPIVTRNSEGWAINDRGEALVKSLAKRNTRAKGRRAGTSSSQPTGKHPSHRNGPARLIGRELTRSSQSLGRSCTASDEQQGL